MSTSNHEHFSGALGHLWSSGTSKQLEMYIINPNKLQQKEILALTAA